MTFDQIIRRMAADAGFARGLSRDSVLEAYRASYPTVRAVSLAPTPQFADKPPVVIPGVEWRDGAYRVENIEQVQRVIATARHRGRRVRTAGAEHSTKGAVYSQSDRDLRVVLRGQLQHVKIDPIDVNSARVCVGGGCYLGVNPADPESTEANSLNFQLDALGYALPILGGISHQTIAGFLQTGSAGGSLAHGFADVIEEIQLVDGTGAVQTFSAGTPAFAAAGVSMGLFGIITRVTLKVGRRFFVKGAETNHVQSDSLLAPDAQGTYPLEEALEHDEYLHLNWFPQPGVGRVTEWRGRCSETNGPRDPYDTELKQTWMNVVAAAVLYLTSVLLLAPGSKIVQRIVADLLKLFVEVPHEELFNDAWHLTLPCDDQVRVDTLIRVVFTEIWLPRRLVSPILTRLQDMLIEPGAAGNFAVEFYGAKRSPFWLSPSFERDVVRVDVFWFAYSVGNSRKHFARFWNVLLDLPDARLHWGKDLPDVGKRYGSVMFDIDFLRARYKHLDEWLQMRRMRDPFNVFVTTYWQQLLRV